MKHKKEDGKVTTALRNSPINYFSDLFVAVMVVGWIVVLVIMIIFAIYAEVTFADTSMWSYVADTITVPLSAGGAIWMIKNAVQHAIANHDGKQAHMDFPKVEVDELEQEKKVTIGSKKEAQG